MSEQRLERIEIKVDKLSDSLGRIDSTLAAQHESLKEHMRRSYALEAQVEPLRNHVAMVNGVVKFLGLTSMVAAIASAIYAIVHK